MNIGPGIFFCLMEKKTLKRILLIRHCESTHAGKRYIGRTDTPLTPTGKEQALRLAVRLKPVPVDRVVASPSLRALDTAGPVVEERGLSIEVDEELREVDFGEWEELSFEEIRRKDPEMVAEWARGGMDFRFPGGESLSAFGNRVRRAGNRLISLPDEGILVVTHGGVVRFMLCHFLGLPPQSHLMFDIRPGSITTLHLDRGYAVLTGLNDCCHLEES